MSDVTALVLSIGEPYTDRAVASVAHQTLAVAETVVVRNVAPVHAALNRGVMRVPTPFFIVVDADMILDATCVEILRNVMAPTVGVVVGFLRDLLLGRIVGVKMYRTDCVRETPFPGSVSPDADVVKQLDARGWTTARALCRDSQHTFGRHEPDYTLPYTYAKFVMSGVRHHYRRKGTATRALFRRLCRSAHPLAPVATAALAHGLFVDASGDLLDARRRWHVPAVLTDFDTAPAGGVDPQPGEPIEPSRLDDVFVRGYRSGRARSGAGPEVVHGEYARLAAEWNVPSWVSAVGFFHGLLCEADDPPEPERAFARFAVLLSDDDDRGAS